MVRDEVRAEVCRLLFGQPVPESELSDDDDLFEAGLDSMGVLKLVAWVEKKTARELGDEEVKTENFRSIRALIALIGC
jgi:acyl carrier protein